MSSAVESAARPPPARRLLPEGYRDGVGRPPPLPGRRFIQSEAAPGLGPVPDEDVVGRLRAAERVSARWLSKCTDKVLARLARPSQIMLRERVRDALAPLNADLRAALRAVASRVDQPLVPFTHLPTLLSEDSARDALASVLGPALWEAWQRELLWDRNAVRAYAKANPGTPAAVYLRLSDDMSLTRRQQQGHDSHRRILEEAAWAHEQGWFPLFVTFTHADWYLAEQDCHGEAALIDEYARSWRVFVRRLIKDLRKEAGLAPLPKNAESDPETLSYFKVLDWGAKKHRFHVHAVMFVKVVPSAWGPPMVPGFMDSDRAPHFLHPEKYWRMGRCRVQPVRTSPKDVWGKLGCPWPKVGDGTSFQPGRFVDGDGWSPATGALSMVAISAYVGGYVARIPDEAPKGRRCFDASRGFGYRGLDAVLAALPACDLRPLAHGFGFDDAMLRQDKTAFGPGVVSRRAQRERERRVRARYPRRVVRLMAAARPLSMADAALAAMARGRELQAALDAASVASDAWSRDVVAEGELLEREAVAVMLALVRSGGTRARQVRAWSRFQAARPGLVVPDRGELQVMWERELLDLMRPGLALCYDSSRQYERERERLERVPAQAYAPDRSPAARVARELWLDGGFDAAEVAEAA